MKVHKNKEKVFLEGKIKRNEKESNEKFQTFKVSVNRKISNINVKLNNKNETIEKRK